MKLISINDLNLNTYLIDNLLTHYRTDRILKLHDFTDLTENEFSIFIDKNDNKSLNQIKNLFQLTGLKFKNS